MAVDFAIILTFAIWIKSTIVLVPNFNNIVNFRQSSFVNYHDRFNLKKSENIMENNYDIPNNSLLILVGVSGSGKSTIAKK